MRVGRVVKLLALRNQTGIYRGLVSECTRQVGSLEVSAEGKTCFSVVKETLRAFPGRGGVPARFEAPLLPLHQL